MIELYFQDCDKRIDTRKWSHDEIVEDDNGKLICSNCEKRPTTKGCMVVSGELKLPRPYTVTGLAVWLGTSRRTLLNYECREEFFHTIEAARQRIEAYAEERLFDPKVPTHGVKFSLSNNHDGWTEKNTTTLDVHKDGATELARRVFDDAVSERIKGSGVFVITWGHSSMADPEGGGSIPGPTSWPSAPAKTPRQTVRRGAPTSATPPVPLPSAETARAAANLAATQRTLIQDPFIPYPHPRQRRSFGMRPRSVRE